MTTVTAPSGARATINAMTVDVEDYFHVSNFASVVTRESWSTRESRVERNTDRLLEIFADAGVSATFFVLAWVAERHPQLIAKIAAAGHEIASHGYAHQLVYDEGPDGFRRDIRRAKALLEDASGQRVEGYRAPSFSITGRSVWAIDILLEEGYRYDSSIYPIRHDRYGIPDSPRHVYAIERPAGTLIEIPVSTVRVGGMHLPIGGGGYFRLLPYGWTRWGIARVNRIEERAAIFYLHPWEIDPEQPRLPAGPLARYRHYSNLDQTELRLRRLLREFRFGPMRALLGRTTVPAAAAERLALEPALR